MRQNNLKFRKFIESAAGGEFRADHAMFVGGNRSCLKLGHTSQVYSLYQMSSGFKKRFRSGRRRISARLVPAKSFGSSATKPLGQRLGIQVFKTEFRAVGRVCGRANGSGPRTMQPDKSM